MALPVLVLAIAGIAGLASLRGLKAQPAEQIFEALHSQNNVPGMAVAVALDGEIIWHFEVGLADVEKARPVRPETIFRLASVSKAVCAVMAADLISAGKLSPGTRVGDLLPGQPRQYQDLLFRQLMTHSSGLPHYQMRDAGRGRRQYETALAGLAELGDRQLIHAPGSIYSYSTHGFSLASAMMEAAAGQSFPDLFAELISATATGAGIALEQPDKLQEDRSEIYAGNRNGEPQKLSREDFSYSWCGAGMQASAVGLASFGASLFAQSSPLSASGKILISQPLAGPTGKLVEGERWLMTLGWRLAKDQRGDPFIHHSGVTNGARSVLAVWPQRRVAVALLSNASWTSRMETTAEALAAAVLGEAEPGACPPAGSGSYRGVFAGDSIEAHMEWHSAGGSCQATLSGQNALVDWASRFNFAETSAFPLIRLDTNRWGLVTPIGISILIGDPSRLEGFVGSRPLELTATRQ